MLTYLQVTVKGCEVGEQSVAKKVLLENGPEMGSENSPGGGMVSRKNMFGRQSGSPGISTGQDGWQNSNMPRLCHQGAFVRRYPR